jgi:hypothetical protein
MDERKASAAIIATAAMSKSHVFFIFFCRSLFPKKFPESWTREGLVQTLPNLCNGVRRSYYGDT